MRLSKRNAALAQLVEQHIRNVQVAGSIPAGGSINKRAIMNREAIKLSLREVTKDRPYVLLIGLILVLGLGYCLAITLSIHPSDVTVYTRYTAFGEAHFYKDHWQYLITFVLYGAIVAVAHSALMVKLHDMGRKQTGLLVGWLGVAVLLMAFAYTLAIIGLGHAA